MCTYFILSLYTQWSGHFLLLCAIHKCLQLYIPSTVHWASGSHCIVYVHSGTSPFGTDNDVDVQVTHILHHASYWHCIQASTGALWPYVACCTQHTYSIQLRMCISVKSNRQELSTGASYTNNCYMWHNVYCKEVCHSFVAVGLMVGQHAYSTCTQQSGACHISSESKFMDGRKELPWKLRADAL